jgi:hypothetical protein
MDPRLYEDRSAGPGSDWKEEGVVPDGHGLTLEEQLLGTSSSTGETRSSVSELPTLTRPIRGDDSGESSEEPDASPIAGYTVTWDEDGATVIPYDGAFPADSEEILEEILPEEDDELWGNWTTNW